MLLQTFDAEQKSIGHWQSTSARMNGDPLRAHIAEKFQDKSLAAIKQNSEIQIHDLCNASIACSTHAKRTIGRNCRSM